MGRDLYYDESVVAYEEGTSWNVSLSVKNDYSHGMPAIPEAVNITGIKVYFDWGEWYNYTFDTPVRMEIDEVKVFTVRNVTPTIEEAPETWVHEYWIYVEYIPESGGDVRTDWNWHGDNFAIMSEDHLAALQLYNKLVILMDVDPPLWYTINVTKARVLMIQAAVNFVEGTSYYTNGIFSTARESLQGASNLLDEALSIWDERGTALENAATAYKNAEANYYNALADSTIKESDAALTNSYGWLFFGLGWTLLGIGIIIYEAEKPKTVQS